MKLEIIKEDEERLFYYEGDVFNIDGEGYILSQVLPNKFMLVGFGGDRWDDVFLPMLKHRGLERSIITPKDLDDYIRVSDYEMGYVTKWEWLGRFDYKNDFMKEIRKSF